MTIVFDNTNKYYRLELTPTFLISFLYVMSLLILYCIVILKVVMNEKKKTLMIADANRVEQ